MGDTQSYVVVACGREYRVEAEAYRTNDADELMFFDGGDEPVAKFNQVEWLTVYRKGAAEWEQFDND